MCVRTICCLCSAGFVGLAIFDASRILHIQTSVSLILHSSTLNSNGPTAHPRARLQLCKLVKQQHSRAQSIRPAVLWLAGPFRSQQWHAPRNSLPPLLTSLQDRTSEPLHYLGVSYGLTQELFWSKAKFAPLCLRLTPNELTEAHMHHASQPARVGELMISARDSGPHALARGVPHRLPLEVPKPALVSTSQSARRLDHEQSVGINCLTRPHCFSACSCVILSFFFSGTPSADRRRSERARCRPAPPSGRGLDHLRDPWPRRTRSSSSTTRISKRRTVRTHCCLELVQKLKFKYPDSCLKN